MKKLLSFILLFLLSFSLFACNGNTQPNSGGGEGGGSGTGGEGGGGSQVEPADELSINIHYKRTAGDYTGWSLWLWKTDGHKFDFNGTDDFGVYAKYTLEEIGVTEEDKMGLIVAKNPGSTWDAKDGNNDRFVDFSLYEKDDKNCYNIYLFQGEEEMYSNASKAKPDNISKAYFKTTKKAYVVVSNPASAYELLKDTTVVKSGTLDNVTEFNVELEQDINIGDEYGIKVEFAATKTKLTSTVAINKLYNDAFDAQYAYDGELGAIYTKEQTTFKVWSPVSKKIELIIYNNGTPKALDASKGSDEVFKKQEMTKGEKGVFELTVTGDLEGKYYTYKVYNSQNKNGKEIVDPYAKSAGVNGQRGMIVDFSKTNPEGWDSVSALQIDRKALTVYELHVADLTSSATWGGTAANAKKFLGLKETGTTYTENGTTVKTGFDHIKELGVNAVQLLPIFDQANDEVNVEFNWGYNPLNYNCLEGCYSSNPYDGYARIREFKQVVQAYNQAGINIIMDVVYNHTNSVIGTNFDVLMPGYYFRYNNDGSLSNGSGCGNETASERRMFRKFMIDSTNFWMEEYKLGGFRFDLMGLHDLETMKQVVETCETINPGAVIYGEPWTGGSSTLNENLRAVQKNANQYEGYGAFNDVFRDELVKGGLNPSSSLSWISCTYQTKLDDEKMAQGIRGVTKVGATILPGPDYSINYATCHDNYTLYDRFRAAGITFSDLKGMAMLANSMVFTSQGTAFMLSGEEFLRTKQLNNNSYNASYQVNELNYSLKIKNIDMFENYKKLISLKQTSPALHLDDDHNDFEVEFLNSNNTIRYKLIDNVNNIEYVIIHQNGRASGNTEEIDLTGYTLYLDTLGKYADEALGQIELGRFETIIAYKTIE